MDEFLKCLGFVQSTGDPCIYVGSGEEMIIGVHMDDIVIAGKSEKQVEEFKQALGERFDMKYLGKLHYFLGIQIVQDDSTGEMWMGQPAYINKPLEKFGMEDAKLVATPCDAGNNLVKAEARETRIDQGIYQSAFGSLMYLATGTRPDITLLH